MVLAAAMIVTLLFGGVAVVLFVRSLRKDMRKTSEVARKDPAGNLRP